MLYFSWVMWVLICFFRWSRRPNFLPQVEHANGLTPEWILLCLVNSSFRVKVLLHVSHLNGRSPVCVRIWLLSWPLFENLATSQCGHLNFFGLSFLELIIFDFASSANTLAYSCSRIAFGNVSKGFISE